MAGSGAGCVGGAVRRDAVLTAMDVESVDAGEVVLMLFPFYPMVTSGGKSSKKGPSPATLSWLDAAFGAVVLFLFLALLTAFAKNPEWTRNREGGN